jgi:hypothetical protein
MSIFRYRERDTGRERAHLTASWSLTHEDVAGLIIARLEPQTFEDLERKRTIAELLAAAREQLAVNADARHWWADDYADEHPGEPTAEDVEEWGLAQARRL